MFHGPRRESHLSTSELRKASQGGIVCTQTLRTGGIVSGVPGQGEQGRA